MTYSVFLRCDTCGAESPEAPSTQEARLVAEKGGWFSVRHLGKHYCRACGVPVQSPPPAPRRTWASLRAEQWAGKREKLKILLNLRRKGKTLRECGEAIGVSAERARGLLKQAEQAETRGWTYRDHNGFFPNSFDPDSTPIEEYGFTVRAANCFKNANVRTLAQAFQMSDRELLAIPNFGRNCLHELRQAQSELGLI